MKMLKQVAIATGCLLLSVPAFAQDGGNVGLGKSLAEANCSQCHNIEAGGEFKQFPPSFAAIAVYMNPEIIRQRILTPTHVLMPEFKNYMNLSSVDALVSYIQSLEK